MAALMVFRKSHLRVHLPENAAPLPGPDNREIEVPPTGGMGGGSPPAKNVFILEGRVSPKPKICSFPLHLEKSPPPSPTKSPFLPPSHTK